MKGFYRSFNGDSHTISCSVREPGLWIAGRYIPIVPAELSGREFIDSRGNKHHERDKRPWLFEWLRPVVKDDELILESADPYIPPPDEIRSDGALVILSAFLRKGQFAVWEFPDEATILGEDVGKGQPVVEMTHCRRYLLEMPLDSVARCVVVTEKGSIVRQMSFHCKTVRHTGWRGGSRYDRTGNRVYKWTQDEVFWPWILRGSKCPKFRELPDRIQAVIRRTIGA